jgi:tRNA 2-selenouridine synthase SelU
MSYLKKIFKEHIKTKVFKHICPKIKSMIKGSLSKELEEMFRRKAMEKYGYSKGAVSKALEAAIKLWLRYDYESTDEEECNNKAFESMINKLEEKYKGMYVVIANGKLISTHKSLSEALKVKKDRYKHRIVFKVGEKPTKKVRLGWRVTTKHAGRT